MEFNVTIEVTSPIHLGAGQANVNLDADIVSDALGFPYFPAKRFKGLLYESAIEVYEMFEIAGISTKNLATPENLFHRISDDEGNVSDTRLIVPNFYIRKINEYKKLCDEWKFLQKNYPEVFNPTDVLNTFTSIRYQTELEDGVAAKGSLHNMRVLNEGIKFFGKIIILNESNKVLNLFALALKNLSSAGTKRNRGFGRITCTATLKNDSVDAFVDKFFQREAR